MTYIIIKVGDQTALFANSDCYVQVLLDWLRLKLAATLPPWPVLLDLCDNTGVLRFLHLLPPTTSATVALPPHTVYHPVIGTPAAGGATSLRLLDPPSAAPEKVRELQQRVAKCCANWDRFKLRLHAQPTLEQLLEAIRRSMARSSRGPAVGDQRGRAVAAKLRRPARSERSPGGRRSSTSLSPTNSGPSGGELSIGRRRLSGVS